MNKKEIINKLSETQGTLDFFYKFFETADINAKQKMIEIVILRIQEVIDELRK